MDRLYQGVLWQMERLPAEQWCNLSLLLLAIVCCVFLKGAGAARRM